MNLRKCLAQHRQALGDGGLVVLLALELERNVAAEVDALEDLANTFVINRQQIPRKSSWHPSNHSKAYLGQVCPRHSAIP